MWEYEQGPESYNLTGIISMVSPFDGYHMGDLSSWVHVTSDWDITGAADLNLDTRKYTLILEGVYAEKVKYCGYKIFALCDYSGVILNFALFTAKVGYAMNSYD